MTCQTGAFRIDGCLDGMSAFRQFGLYGCKEYLFNNAAQLVDHAQM
jgi:hypothetical protein